MTSGYSLATNGQAVCIRFANLQVRKFSIQDANTMQAMIGFKPHKHRQDTNLPMLCRSLLFSLIFHVSFGLWLTEKPRSQQQYQFLDTQPLQITLNNSLQTSPATARRGSKTLANLPSPGPAIAVVEDATPAPLPLPPAPDQAYVAPEDVEEMAFVVDVEELPLPNSEQTPNGALYLKILISESGSADRIDIVTSTLPEDYAETLINSFYQARFSPARTAGLPVKSWRILEIRFGDAEPASS